MFFIDCFQCFLLIVSNVFVDLFSIVFVDFSHVFIDFTNVF